MQEMAWSGKRAQPRKVCNIPACIRCLVLCPTEVGSNLYSMESALVKIRSAVRACLSQLLEEQPLAKSFGVAVSGGADSLALAGALALESKNLSIDIFAIIIDHQLQTGSDTVAQECAKKLHSLGIDNVYIKKVKVDITDGLESSARRARYRELQTFLEEKNLAVIFLGHTKNDQAETVLLGLARGSGTRSLSGMARSQEKFVRPLLDISRNETEAACDELSVKYWQDPHNEDKKYLRVRARKIMPILEAEIGPGITDALARSAKLLRDDADALDGYANQFFEKVNPEEIEISELINLPKAVRSRVIRLAAYHLGSPPGSLSADHIQPIEALITQWRGQGASSLPGGVKVERISGRLSLSRRRSEISEVEDLGESGIS
jgi:tRNA(Ile)-lysidine synthase